MCTKHIQYENAHGFNPSYALIETYRSIREFICIALTYKLYTTLRS